MTISLLIAGILCLLAFFAHAFIGDKELLELKPEQTAPLKIGDTWIQARAGWHWVSVDLFLSGVVLLLIATTDIITAKTAILKLLGSYFLICGVVWLVTVFLSKSRNQQLIVLGQWLFCALVSALIFSAT